MTQQKYCVDCGDRCGTSCGGCSLPLCIFCEMHECGLSFSTGAMEYVQTESTKKSAEIDSLRGELKILRKELEKLRAQQATCTCAASLNVENIEL